LKKTISILFASIVLLNAIGFQLFFSAYNFKINTTLDTQIDEGKTSGIQKIIFKKAIIHLPYLPSKPIENDLKGELSYGGNVYRYVKSTILKDTVYYQCVANPIGKQIKNTFTDYVKKNNNQASNNKKNGTIGQKIIKNYLANPYLGLPIISSISLKNNWYHRYNSLLAIGNTNNAVPPPRLVA
jgi:hypothetical protein